MSETCSFVSSRSSFSRCLMVMKWREIEIERKRVRVSELALLELDRVYPSEIKEVSKERRPGERENELN